MSRKPARRLLSLGLLLASWLACGTVHAELRALLVGVSGYPTLAASERLQGPRNDVLLMRRVLMGRGFAAERIETLADGVAGAASPTRAAILASLARLASEAKPGDVVFLLFAGHGSRQPGERTMADGRREPDGLHETFLPIDIGTWDGGSGGVRNAITDVELRAAVEAIEARGAFVWGVFDVCHAGTLVRGDGGDDARVRDVDPRVLGIGDEALTRAAGAGGRSGARARGTGMLGGSSSVAEGAASFFYAAQSDETTKELPLPETGAVRRVHGLFTWTIATALESAPASTYRQLADYVLTAYRQATTPTPTPLFTGNGLDTPLFGQGSVAVRQWRIERSGSQLAIAAGTLSGIGVGSLLAVVDGALADRDSSAGYVEATEVEPTRAIVVPVAAAGRATPALDAFRSTTFARLVGDPLRFALRITVDASVQAVPNAVNALASLRQDGVPGTKTTWVASRNDADVVLRAGRDALVLVQPSDALLEAPATEPTIALIAGGKVLTADVLATQIADTLFRIARARGLLAAAERLASRTVAGPSPTSFRASLGRVDPRGATREEIAIGAVAIVHDRAVLGLSVENTGRTAIDLTVLYLNAGLGVTVLHPDSRGGSNRIDAGMRTELRDIRVTAVSEGVERLILIVSAARTLGERADFSSLKQPPKRLARGDAEASGTQPRVVLVPGTTMQVYSLRVER